MRGKIKLGSFSCPHRDFERDQCMRLHKDCVPGRSGCVLEEANFAFPVEDRLDENEEQ